MTASKFRHCPKSRGLRHRLSVWAWLLIAVGAMLLAPNRILRHCLFYTVKLISLDNIVLNNTDILILKYF